MNLQTFGFIGLGLIGGSIAKAIRKFHPTATIIAYDNCIESLQLAKSENILDTYIASFELESYHFANCDVIFLCTPVEFNHSYLNKLIGIVPDTCLFTDVGSVKNPIHQTVNALQITKRFIGGHPMAGSERSGYSASTATLLENAYYILTPESEVSSDIIRDFSNFISSLSALPITMDSNYHDYVTAAISHLPHMLAYSLVHTIQMLDDENHTIRAIAAGGFKDITRIAGSSPVMWQQICSENKTSLLELMDKYIAYINELKDMIEAEESNALYDYFYNAKEYRNSFDSVINGPISRAHYITVSIIDKAGAIADISTLFANNNISMKNIGIVHNREFEEGVLRIVFYDDGAKKAALSLLKGTEYIVYEK